MTSIKIIGSTALALLTGLSPALAQMTAVGDGEGQLNIVAWAGYIERGETDKAVQAFKTAAELQPMNPHALLELGMQYHATNNPKKVSEVIKRLREFDPKAMKQLMQATQTSTDAQKN